MEILLIVLAAVLALIAARLLQLLTRSRTEAAGLRDKLGEVRSEAQQSYASGYNAGLDDGYRRSEQQKATSARKRLIKDMDGRVGLN